MAEVSGLRSLTKPEMEQLNEWIDNAQVFRPKKSLARDFSDAVLAAEVIAFYCPKLVELHNYSPVQAPGQKKINWEILNRKVLSKLKLTVPDLILQQIAKSTPGAVNGILWDIRRKIIELYPSLDARKTRPVNQLHLPVLSRAGGSGGSRRAQPSYVSSEEKVGASLSGSLDEQLDPSVSEFDADEDESVFASGPRPANISTTSGGNSNSNEIAPKTSSSALTPPEKSYLSTAANINEFTVEEDDNGNAFDANGIPTHIIYRGHKMVAAKLVEDAELKAAKMEQVCKDMSKKINLAETIIAIKDKRIEELTHQYLQTMNELSPPE